MPPGENATVPSIWKCGRVASIFKNGDQSDPNNYRPISIICTTANIFEKFVFNQLSQYLNCFNILSPVKSGFRPNYSTTTALLKSTNDVLLSSGKSLLTGAIFIDLSKAFDIVDHYLLLDKLHSIGLQRNALLWFNAYLHNRRQCVALLPSVLQGNQSDYLIIEKGVPQGSTLGPLIFSIFINNLPDTCLHTQVQLYADDTVIYFSGSDIMHIQASLQSDFNHVQKWLHDNKLVLNRGKSCSMVFGPQHSQASSAELCIGFSNGSHLEQVN